MLTNLHVKNLALIEEADINFDNGLNILTGETGAGKSIVLGSVNIALGNKVSADIIRKGADYALTELVFSIQDEQTLELLKALDIEELDDGEVLISRKIMPSRSIIKVNGQTMTAGQVRQLATVLIDIHGQHDNQVLLNENRHLQVVDEYGADAIAPIKAKLKKAYEQYSEVLSRLNELDSDDESRIREISFTEYEVHEIESAALNVGEDDELESDFKRMSNSQKIMESISIVDKAVASGDDNITDMLGMAVKAMNSVSAYDSRLEQLSDLLSDIDSMVSDASRSISDYIDEYTFNEEEFSTLQRRLDLINSMKMKYGSSVSEIIAYCEQKKEHLEQLYDYDNVIKKLNNELEEHKNQVLDICEKLSATRKKSAKRLCKSIEEALRGLNFLDVRFGTEFTTTEHFGANGNDNMRFIISTNPGEDMKPLSKIASGGELSRIMLAIKTVIANQDNIDTLIFDEIDAGISGRTAQMVANQLSRLSRKHQIICITHLPQIASMSDVHFMIEKSSNSNVTTTAIHKLDEKQSIEELARLLGGSQVTEASLMNARDMKQTAASLKD